MTKTQDTLIVSGARCVWWDDISQASKAHLIPTCPHCGSPLFQHDPAVWWAGVDRHEAQGHPGYRAMAEWSRGKCFRKFSDAEAAYAEHLERKS